MTQNNNMPQGYKDSPLGIIPKEWEVKNKRTAFQGCVSQRMLSNGMFLCCKGSAENLSMQIFTR